jgi:molybdopterin-guanine dinucleotide biosynthesis protein A
MRASTTAAAIVAGGRASRFGGQDKSRLVVEGRTIIVRQVEVLQRVASSLLVVAQDASRFADLPVVVVPDRIPGLGAVGGIDAALHALPDGCDRVIVVASDLPGLTPALLAALAERAGNHDGAWVCGPQGPEPLIACYRRHCRTPVADYIARGGRRASGLEAVLALTAIEGAELEHFGDPARLLANINTPEDYARVQYRPA